ncbi:MAG: right-handed parallel beta-helix repeat-containing protein [Planctomycetaceae bacterium]|nr:right-handed parallel beta-helix repeat-containing protein [Planctomycetaceae bacterium]
MIQTTQLSCTLRLVVIVLMGGIVSHAADAIVSHPPLRQVQVKSSSALPPGPLFYVHGSTGNDAADGSRERPWKSVQSAIERLRAGDTLVLRGGVYYEQLYVALAGTADKPITIRSEPGERVIVDGGVAEFFTQPDQVWEPAKSGVPDEYQTVRTYPNLRTVVAQFGDSMVGLQTYYHRQDLIAASELVDWPDWEKTGETDLKPIYLGPGLWYDTQTSRLHARFSHTHLPQIANYQGETDPRKLPLVVAPFNATPLHVDGGEHLVFQDIEFRGGGYKTVVLDHATHCEFRNVTIWCGTYGIQASRTQHLHLNGSRLYGNLAPWSARADASKRDYPDRPHRNLSRLNTHALIEIDAGRESSVYFSPQNNHWLIEHCHLADAHDGVYLGGMNARFHHNLVENLQDDGIYLSPMYLRHKLDKTKPQIHIHENVFRGLLTALAFGGSEPDTDDQLHVYRNLFDLRASVFTARPSTRKAESTFSTGKLIGDHGSPPWPALNFYHNTVVSQETCRDADMSSTATSRVPQPHRVFNNIFFHMARLPNFTPPTPAAAVASDGNVYWSPQADQKAGNALFDRYRKSPAFVENQPFYAPGSTTHSRFARPFAEVATPTLSPGSPAIDAGVELPADWADPLAKHDRGARDVGALPLGVAPVLLGPQR